MSSKISKTNSFLSGLLFGSLIGGTIALLFAPQPGEETRTIIKEKSQEIKDKAVESGAELRQRGEEIAEKTRTQIEEKVGAARESAAALGERGQAMFEEQRERIKGAIEAGRKNLKAEPVENGVEVAAE